MSKNFFLKEFGKAKHKLIIGEGTLRERIAEAYVDLASAYSLKPPFFRQELEEMREFFDAMEGEGLKAVSVEQLRKVASAVSSIDVRLTDYLDSEPE